MRAALAADGCRIRSQGSDVASVSWHDRRASVWRLQSQVWLCDRWRLTAVP